MTMSKHKHSDIEQIVFDPIGYVRCAHSEADKTPIQPVYSRGCRGRIELFPQYMEALDDLDGFSHIFVIYHFHKAGPTTMKVVPFLDDVPRGVFATRSPRRPNPIGFSLVRLVRREGTVLYVEDEDMLDGTPVLDIKPYVPRFDYRKNVRAGWQEHVDGEVAQVRGRRNAPQHEPADNE